jgi:hypothetical protein
VHLKDIAEAISKGLNVPLLSIPAEKASEHFGMFFGRAATVEMPGSSEWTRQTLWNMAACRLSRWHLLRIRRR